MADAAATLREWVHSRLDAMGIDTEVYTSYILGLVESDDDDTKSSIKDIIQSSQVASVFLINEIDSCFTRQQK